MILANPPVLRLQLEKPCAGVVPVTTPVMIEVPQAQVSFASPPDFS